MRSNNFFDQFNNELDGTVDAVKLSLVIAGSVFILTIGAACFWLF